MSFVISVLKAKDIISIKQKLILLYILNVADIIFTLFLVNTGMFLEANTIMATLVNNRQLVILVIKIVVPVVLLIGVYVRMKKATEKQLYQSNIIITATLALYVLINISHIIWSIMYILM